MYIILVLYILGSVSGPGNSVRFAIMLSVPDNLCYQCACAGTWIFFRSSYNNYRTIIIPDNLCYQNIKTVNVYCTWGGGRGHN